MHVCGHTEGGEKSEETHMSIVAVPSIPRLQQSSALLISLILNIDCAVYFEDFQL